MTTTFKTKILSLGLFLTSYLGIAQSFDLQYQKAVNSRYQRQFEQADSVFKIILRKHKKNLPEALCYHYGVVLYELHQTEKAKGFLNKYLSFTHNSLPLKDSAYHYLKLMDVHTPIIPKAPEKTAYADTCDQCHGKGIALQNCHRCSGSGKILCYQCKGTGLIGTSSDIGTSKFNPCTICHGSGTMLCALCKGDKIIEDKCSQCNGKGKIIIYK